jgi:hypothetical protein
LRCATTLRVDGFRRGIVVDPNEPDYPALAVLFNAAAAESGIIGWRS